MSKKIAAVKANRLALKIGVGGFTISQSNVSKLTRYTGATGTCQNVESTKLSTMIPKIELREKASRSIYYNEHVWPSDQCYWHTHNEYEIHFLVASKGRAFVGDYISDFQEGDLFLIGPNLPHNWVSESAWTETQTTRDMLVQFSDDSFRKLSEGFPEVRELLSMLTLARSGIQFVDFDPTNARDLMEKIRDTEGLERFLAFMKLMTGLAKHPEMKILSSSKYAPSKGNQKNARIEIAIDYIVTNFDRELSLSHVAEVADMSELTFSRRFLASTGQNFVQFVNTIRINQACFLLFTTDKMIIDIARETGFRNMANFNRNFLKLRGMVPSKYRDAAKVLPSASRK